MTLDFNKVRQSLGLARSNLEVQRDSARGSGGISVTQSAALRPAVSSPLIPLPPPAKPKKLTIDQFTSEELNNMSIDDLTLLNDMLHRDGATKDSFAEARSKTRQKRWKEEERRAYLDFAKNLSGMKNPSRY